MSEKCKKYTMITLASSSFREPIRREAFVGRGTAENPYCSVTVEMREVLEEISSSEVVDVKDSCWGHTSNQLNTQYQLIRPSSNV